MEVKCERCADKTSTTKMSRFDTKMLCEKCLETEQQSPLYPIAYDVEHAYVTKRVYNYKGIGGHWNLPHNAPGVLVNAAQRWLLEKYKELELDEEKYTKHVYPEDQKDGLKEKESQIYEVFKFHDQVFTDLLPNLLIGIIDNMNQPDN